MKTVSVSHLKASLSEYLAAVKTGEEVVVTERGKPIAKLVRLVEPLDDRARLMRMAAEGRIKLPERWPTKESIEAFLRMPIGEDPTGSVLRDLIEDREED